MVRSSAERDKAVRQLMGELESARGKMPRLPIAWLQNLTTALAALAVVTVALSYLMGIALIFWLTLDYAISHARLVGEEGIGGLVYVYILLGIFGLLAVLLLLKPALNWGAREGRPVAIDRRDQPELYAYVEKLCEVMNAPKPGRIEVDLDANASASLSGFAMGLFSRRPVLTLGLSLVTGMDMQQITGVLAHELAHFKQGRGTRFRLLINAINRWFAQVVYGRDRFDLWVRRLSSAAIVGLPLLPVSLLLWLGRKILWLFMMMAHGASALVSRRGEYEADKFMAAVIGSEQVGPTLQRIAVLNLCLDGTREELGSSLMAGRLPDDVPALVAARAQSLSDDRKRQVTRLLQMQKPAWHNTHPTLVQRTRAALELGAEPLVRVQGPASLLFYDLEEVCRTQTTRAYEAVMGEDFDASRVVPTEQIVEELQAADRAHEALVRFYQCQPLVDRPILPSQDAVEGPPPDAYAVSDLATVRERMLSQAQDFDGLCASMLSVRERKRELNMALRLIQAGVKVKPEDVGLNQVSPMLIRAELNKLESEEHYLWQGLSNIEPLIQRRLNLAISLLRHPRVAESLGEEVAQVHHTQVRKVAEASWRVQRAMERALELSAALDGTVALLQVADRAPDRARHKRAMKRSAEELVRLLDALQFRLRNVAYPFEHHDGQMQLNTYVVPHVPEDARDVPKLVFYVGEVLERFQALTMRCMAHSAQVAEQVEEAAGFESQPTPQWADPFEEVLQEAQRSPFGRDRALSDRWGWHVFGAAVNLVVIFVTFGGLSLFTPTMTTAVKSTVVPYHPAYQPTIVPTAVIDPSVGPQVFDPVRGWRVSNIPGPSDPGFYQPRMPNLPGVAPDMYHPSPRYAPSAPDPYQHLPEHMRPDRYQRGYNPNTYTPGRHDPYRHLPEHMRPDRNNRGYNPSNPGYNRGYNPSRPGGSYNPSRPGGSYNPGRSNPGGPSPGGPSPGGPSSPF